MGAYGGLLGQMLAKLHMKRGTGVEAETVDASPTTSFYHA